MNNLQIIENNLNQDQIFFIQEELARTITAAERNNLRIPFRKIILIAKNTEDIPVDSAPFQIYAERKREEQHYTLYSENNTVTITGGGYPGVLYGFYAFLRMELGAEWSGLTDDDIVFHPQPAKEKTELKPAVPFRGMNGVYPELDKAYIFKFLRYMARNQWNMLMQHVWRWDACAWQDELLRFAKVCAVEFNIGGHSMENFIPESLFETHPEFFGMRDGKRCVRGSAELPDLGIISENAPIQPCFTNPEACQFIASNIVHYIAVHPEIKIFSLWPHDGANNWCQCPKCIKTTPYDQMLLLAGKILELAPRPVYLEVLAYCSLLTIPRSTENLERIYTIFCPYLRHYKYQFDAPGYSRDKQRLGRSYPTPDPVNPDDDRDYGLLLKDWQEYLSKKHGTLGIFAYYQLLFFDEKNDDDRPRYLRFPNTALVADELRKFIGRGMTVYYDCSCPYPNLWPDARLYSFHSRLLMDPFCHENELICNQAKALLADAAERVNEITDTLDQGIRNISPAIFSELENICEKMQGNRAKRILIWVAYVRLGCESAIALKRGDRSAFCKAEEAIVKLFEDNSALLKDYAKPEALIAHAKHFMAPRIRDRKTQSNVIA